VFLVTELCPNGNLHRYMEGYPDGLAEEQVRLIMRDIVRGVQGSPLKSPVDGSLAHQGNHAPRSQALEYSFGCRDADGKKDLNLFIETRKSVTSD